MNLDHRIFQLVGIRRTEDHVAFQHGLKSVIQDRLKSESLDHRRKKFTRHKVRMDHGYFLPLSPDMPAEILDREAVYPNKSVFKRLDMKTMKSCTIPACTPKKRWISWMLSATARSMRLNMKLSIERLMIRIKKGIPV
ncbi:hypothetical protein [Pedobacter nototheniae]|uniref:hypothetical protein n=1 Tax=Pedobacter nototheniae TaxID=2488994 RepID=UPI00103FDD92|nr:hypothetical protein [Pedobacter nototheniae]